MDQVQKFLEKEEIREKLKENSLRVDFFTYQITCREGRVQVLDDNVDSFAASTTFCAGCSFSKNRSLKRCFGVITSQDFVNYLETGVDPVGITTS